MRPAAVRLLCCPGCQQTLRLEPRRMEDDDVESGWLVCSRCPKAYHIVRGIPRFVAVERYALSADYRRSLLGRIQVHSLNGKREGEDTLLRACAAWMQSGYRGSIVLDVGVGDGQFAEGVARSGGELVGVDFNASVDAARSRLRRFKNVHLVQADFSALPFRKETFDLAYSVGALHQVSNPKEAFARVASAVKPGGSLAVSFHNHGRIARYCGNQIRRLTTRLPLPAALAITAMSIPMHHVYRLPALGAMLQGLCPISTHPDWRRRWLDTFDWYTATYQWAFRAADVARWFRRSDFSEIEVIEGTAHVRGRKAPSTADRWVAGDEAALRAKMALLARGAADGVVPSPPTFRRREERRSPRAYARLR